MQKFCHVTCGYFAGPIHVTITTHHFYFLFYCHHLHDHSVLPDKNAFIPFFCAFPWSGCRHQSARGADPRVPVLLLPEHPCSASTVTCLPSSTVAETGPKECCRCCVLSASYGGACLVSERQNIVGWTFISKMTRRCCVYYSSPTFAVDHLVLSNISLVESLICGIVLGRLCSWYRYHHSSLTVIHIENYDANRERLR